MSLILDGTNGLSDVDGSAATPAIRGSDANTGVFFGTDVVGLSTGGTERVRVDASGNVGIGTNAPGRTLDVNGSILSRASSGEGGEIAFNNPDNASVGLTVDVSSADAGRVFQTRNNSVLQIGQLAGTGGIVTLHTAATERARIDSSGNLLVGQTSGGAMVDIRSNSASGSKKIFNVLTNGGAEVAVMFQSGVVYLPSTANNTTGAGANFHIATDGLLYRSTSSLKYKCDVQNALHGIAEVMALRPVTYKGNNDGETVFGGLIAEEVHEAGLTEFVQYAADGTPDALHYGNMVSLAFKAIQEQQAIITALTARVEALEGAQA